MRFVICFVLILVTGFSYSQKSRKFGGKSRKDFFGGARDYRQLTKDGIQISFGPNFTFTNPKVTQYSGVDVNGRPATATVDPIGRPGGFIEIGAAHYRLKSSKILAAWYKKRGEKGDVKWIGSNLFHRLDWGLGFNYIGGSERTRFEVVDPSGVSTFDERTGSFYNGYLTARVTIDRFTKIGEGWHLETGLGFNFLFNALPAPKAPYTATVAPVKFQQDFMAQFHLHVGFTRTIRRGDYLTFGLLVPTFGIYEPNKARPTIQWFSSNYWPVQLQIRWIHHFTKKSNGCNTGTPEDRKRNDEYMQNR
ncbi:hypothetical protein [Fluviicola sp.]|uniref:hypothetical protein n=1 Tax=Fluviicola sp. TaxID=1917219 RepID=UPI00261F100C|nr:hypothetical protein [Fluviicola sp.]